MLRGWLIAAASIGALVVGFDSLAQGDSLSDGPSGARPAASSFVSSAASSAASMASASTAISSAGLSAGDATLAEIEACAGESLPESAGILSFAVDAVDRSGAVTSSRAELRWRKDPEARVQVLLRVSEPARTAGTALLILDRAADQPELYVRLPELERVRRIRSRRLRGPVLGTDFSYEDLERLREPLEKAALELVGIADVEGRPAWLLEAVPHADEDSEYSRVLTWVEQEHCLPIRIDLFEGDDRLRKRLEAPVSELRPVGSGMLPHRFVMHDLRRESRTVVRVERVELVSDLPAEQFTKQALQDGSLPAAASH